MDIQAMNTTKWTIGLILFGLLAIASACKANLPDQNTIIHAVVIEASGEPYEAQVGICAVIRTRNSLKGVYGAKGTRYESNKVYAQITKAWNESAKHDPTHGCDLFGGEIDDKYFQGKLHLQPVLTIGHTRFYKSKK